MKLLVSHTDLDGVGSVVLSRKYKLFDNDIMINYPDLESPEFLSLVHNLDYDTIVFADMAPSEELFKRLSETKKVIVYDHHKTSEWLTQYEGSIFDMNRCGTKIFYEEYVKPKHLEDIDGSFVELIDIYDRWLLDNPLRPEAEKLNYLYAGLLNVNTYRLAETPLEFAISHLVNMLPIQDKKIKFTSYQYTYINNEIETQKYAYDQSRAKSSLRTDKEGIEFVIWPSQGYPSYCADQFFKEFEEGEYILMVDVEKENISTRSRGNFDVTTLEGIKGHKNAGGGSFSKNELERLLNKRDGCLSKR